MSTVKKVFDVVNVIDTYSINGKQGLALAINNPKGDARGFSDKVLTSMSRAAGFTDFDEFAMVVKSALDKGQVEVELEFRKKGDKYVDKDGVEGTIREDHDAIISIPVYIASEEIADELKAAQKAILIENRRKKRRGTATNEEPMPF